MSTYLTPATRSCAAERAPLMAIAQSARAFQTARRDSRSAGRPAARRSPRRAAARLPFLVDLHKAQQGVHPRPVFTVQGCADQPHHQVGEASRAGPHPGFRPSSRRARAGSTRARGRAQQKVRIATDRLNGRDVSGLAQCATASPRTAYRDDSYQPDQPMCAGDAVSSLFISYPRCRTNGIVENGLRCR